MKRVFHSIQEIQETYLPKWYKRQQKKKESLGERLANELIARLKKELRKIDKEA